MAVIQSRRGYSNLEPLIYDGGAGVTQISKQLIEANTTGKEKIEEITLGHDDLGLNVEIRFKNHQPIVVSGFSWGYSGEGCRGLCWLFKRYYIPLDMMDIAKLDMNKSYAVKLVKSEYMDKKWEITEL